MSAQALITLDELLSYRHEPVHIVGAVSAEGVAVSQLLLRLGFDAIVVHDQRAEHELRRGFRTMHGAYGRAEQDALWQRLSPLRSQGRFAQRYLEGLHEASLVALGQGWRLDADNRRRIEQALSPGARVTSMTELYFGLAPGPVAAVTGTNGKSTTVALADHLLSHAGVPHRTAGNERTMKQFLGEIVDLPAGTWSLLEVSNRQLAQVEPRASVAAITSLTPDHLDEHDGWAGYQAVKRRLFTAQREGDIAVVNADSETCRSAVADTDATVVSCGIGAQQMAPAVRWNGDTLEHVTDTARTTLAHACDLDLPGAHNQRNAAVACAVALSCGADPASIAAGLRSFAGKALRLEHIETLGRVELYSDIKSTTPEATAAALEALGSRRLTLIAGGTDKGLDYRALGRQIVADGVRVLLVPGSATDKLERSIIENGGAPERVDTIAEALERALHEPEAADAVLVSPAAAGFWTAQLQGKPSLRALARQHAQKHQQQEATTR